MPKNGLIKLGGFASIDDYHSKKNPTSDMTSLEYTVEEAVSNHKRHFPEDNSLVICMHDKTADRFGVNGKVKGFPVRRDRDVPEGCIWVTNVIEM